MNHPALRSALLLWFDAEARDLPWRRTTNPYFIWLSEVILQQTRVDQGLPYYERFTAAFPTVQHLADAPLDRVLKLWEGLGYYTRARNLHLAAKRIVQEHGGAMPHHAEMLQLLPGVGRYTAAAVASIAYGEAVAVVDGNVKRVLSRLHDIESSIDDTATDRALWRLAEELLPAKRPGDFNQAMMELGARICTPRAPQCAACPVQQHCLAYKAGTVHLRPVRKPKAVTPRKALIAAAIKKEQTYLLVRRPDEGLLGGLWEFPAFEMQQAEAPAGFLATACMEQLNLRVKPGGVVANVDHAYTHFRVNVAAYACAWISGAPQPASHVEWAWVAPEEMAGYALHKVQLKILTAMGG